MFFWEGRHICFVLPSVHPSEKFCNCNSLYILSMYSSKLGMLLYYHMQIRLFIVMKVWLNYFWRSCCPFLQLEYFIKKLYMQVLLHFILNSLNSTICEGVIANVIKFVSDLWHRQVDLFFTGYSSLFPPPIQLTSTI